MANIAFILLCHKDPGAIIEQAERLTAAGDYMSIHFDASSNAKDFKQIKDALADNPNVIFAKKRVRCGWGEWSLVQATLNTIEVALDAFPRASHVYLLSGDCMPIKSARYAHAVLDDNDVDYIESFDFFTSDWIQTGMRDDRLIYRHFFNERTQTRLFYTSYEFQKSMGWRRSVPDDLQMMIGSQW
ncbi:MAG: glycosyl transferase, partial [Litoreibacter sp.]|nr:glycosyl transferase [Litoreibacter sp.]